MLRCKSSSANKRIGFDDAFAPVKLAAARNAIAALALDRRVAGGNDTASDVNLRVVRFVVAPQNAVVERMEVVACEHEARAAVEGEIAVVERGGGTGLDALSAVVEQAAIVHVQRAGVFQIHSVAAIAVDARVIKIDDAPVSGRQSSAPLFQISMP